jgi:phosphoglycerate kinase
MKTIDRGRFADKKVLVRVDFNVPLDDDYVITDDRRIRAALPTLHKILNDGGAVILVSHLGRPKKKEFKYSLRHVHHRLAELLDRSVLFCSAPVGSEELAQFCDSLVPGDVALLENIRFHPGEEAGDEKLAEDLAKLADVYVNDAFGTAHRAHASTTLVARKFQEKYAGYLMAAEVENAKRVMNDVRRPFGVVVGGAKVSDKIGVLKNWVETADVLVVGGGMAFTFIRALGGKVGKSLFEADKTETARQILARAQERGIRLILPQDVVAAAAPDDETGAFVCPADQIPDERMGLDVGPKTVEAATAALLTCKTILWNGPVGVFERPAFAGGTLGILDALAQATKTGTYTLVGGGDSAAAVEKFGRAHDVSFVSTGGGALLEYLEFQTLPGIEALG